MKTNKNKTEATGKPVRNTGTAGLRVGDVIKIDGSEHVVWFVNDCRAAVAPLDSSILHRTRDDKIQFLAKADSKNISPNSSVPVIRSLGRKGLAEYLDARATTKTNTTNTMKSNKSSSKNETSTDSKKEKDAPRHGKLGGYKGRSITSVIRAFGKAGWSLAEARAFFKEEKIGVADTTIVIQLRAGRIGEGGEPADFSKKELEAMRPEVEEAPAKGKGKGKPAPAKGKSKPAPKKDEDEEEDDEETVNEDEVEEVVDKA